MEGDWVLNDQSPPAVQTGC